MRIRITFSKTGAMQYVGHLDLHRSWERTFRRSGLPLEYSQGFHPQPHLNLACALPLGFTSQCELLDAWLEQNYTIDQVRSSVTSVLPPGLEIIDIVDIDDHIPALQTQVISAVYRITIRDDIPDIQDRIQWILTSEHLPRIRRDKSYDLRSLIERMTLEVQKDGLHPVMCVQLAAREGATGRPEELLAEMGIRFEDTQIHREKLILITD